MGNRMDYLVLADRTILNRTLRDRWGPKQWLGGNRDNRID